MALRLALMFLERSLQLFGMRRLSQDRVAWAPMAVEVAA
jgi:hypothetical protein